MIGRLRRRLIALVLAALVLITSGIVLTINALIWKNLEDDAYAALQTLTINGGKRPELPEGRPEEPPADAAAEDEATAVEGEGAETEPAASPESGAAEETDTAEEDQPAEMAGPSAGERWQSGWLLASAAYPLSGSALHGPGSQAPGGKTPPERPQGEASNPQQPMAAPTGSGPDTDMSVPMGGANQPPQGNQPEGQTPPEGTLNQPPQGENPPVAAPQAAEEPNQPNQPTQTLQPGGQNPPADGTNQPPQGDNPPSETPQPPERQIQPMDMAPPEGENPQQDFIAPPEGVLPLDGVNPPPEQTPPEGTAPGAAATAESGPETTATGTARQTPPPKPEGSGRGGPRQQDLTQPGQPEDSGAEVAPSLSNYYTITLDENQQVTGWNSDRSDLYTDAQVAALAEAILAEEKEYGHIGTQYYRVSQQEDGSTLIVVLDQRLETATAAQTLRNTLWVTGTALLVLGVLAVLLILKITAPVQEAFDRQKQFVSDASHELKTPLAVISANAEALSREIGENEWLGYIRSEVDRSDRLVQSLLTLARMDQGRLTVQHKPVNLSEAVLSVVLPFESTVFEAGRTLEADIAENVQCVGHDDMLRQLTVILLGNALKYSDEGGSITISLHGRGNRASLRVWNSGEAIGEEDQKHIFDRFYRADASHTEKSGSGLGLAIAKRIVEEHRGRIEVDSAPGRGTAFTVTL